MSELTEEKGNIELSEKGLDQVYLLDGVWGAFENQENIPVGKEFIPDDYVHIPQTWISNAPAAAEGSVIYKLHMTTNLPAGTIICFELITSYACSVYIDNQLIINSDNRYQPVFFNIQTSEFDIVVLMSDKMISVGNQGFRIFMGSTNEMLSFHDSLMLREGLLIGALIIISLYFAALSCYIKNVKYTLHFSVICFLIAVIIDIGNQNILTKRTVFMNTNISILLWYISFCLLMYYIILFLDELCSSHISTIIKKIIKYITAIEILVLILIPAKYYADINLFATLIAFFVCIASLVIVIIGLINRVQDAWPNLCSIVILLVVFFHDGLLCRNAVIPTNKIYLYAVYLILVIQMMIQARRIKIYQEKESLAELSFLQAQIKPHFLYNVMNTLISISRYDMDKARELIYDFNTYLRNSFDIKNYNQLVELKHEIKLIEAYLKIEKARFEERLDFVIKLPDSLEYLVPPLMIQPIIENAIKHGVLAKPEGGFVEIKVEIKDKKIEFLVKDNGVGITTKQLNELKYNQKKGSVGLINIQSRLQKLYNEELKIKSSFGVGTEITWRIPVKTRKEHIYDQCYSHR